MSSERRGYGVPRAKRDQEAPGLRRRRRGLNDCVMFGLV